MSEHNCRAEPHCVCGDDACLEDCSYYERCEGMLSETEEHLLKSPANAARLNQALQRSVDYDRKRQGSYVLDVEPSQRRVSVTFGEPVIASAKLFVDDLLVMEIVGDARPGAEPMKAVFFTVLPAMVFDPGRRLRVLVNWHD